jgi:hypothetical protein
MRAPVAPVDKDTMTSLSPINEGLVFGGFLFVDMISRNRFIRTEIAHRQQWLDLNGNKWTPLPSTSEDAPSHVDAEINLRPTEIGPISSNPRPHPKQDEENAAATDSAKVSEIEGCGPRASTDREKRQPKLSPERMRIVLESLQKSPCHWRAAEKAGVHPKTLAYWLRRSEAGEDGYEITWQGLSGRFHELCAAAIDVAEDRVFEAALQMALGVKYPGLDVYVIPPDRKMLRFLLAWKFPEKYGRQRKINATHRGAVLVIGERANRRESNTAASIRSRRLKLLAKKTGYITDYGVHL